MEKIKITSTDKFIEINYNDLASQFGTARHIFNKETVDMTLNDDKSKMIVTFQNSTFSIVLATLGYIDTTATTVEEFFNEIKLLL